MSEKSDCMVSPGFTLTEYFFPFFFDAKGILNFPSPSLHWTLGKPDRTEAKRTVCTNVLILYSYLIGNVRINSPSFIYVVFFFLFSYTYSQSTLFIFSRD